MGDVYEIISIDPSESFQDVDKDLYNMAEYVTKLEKRISELEYQLKLIGSRSDLLTPSQVRRCDGLMDDD